MPVRWINAGKVSGLRSQSIYHGLAYGQLRDTPNTIVTAIPADPYICVGYFQDASKEVDIDYCRQHNLPVIRRETGGGTVYIDSNQLFIQWICQSGYLPPRIDHRFQLFNKVMIETYKSFGVDAYHYPVNDVHTNGKKIVGTGAATIGEADVVTGNFIFDFDIDTMTQAFNLPTPEFRQQVRQNLDQYISWLKREVDNPPSHETVIQSYVKNLETILGEEVYEGALTDLEMSAIETAEAKLSDEKFVHSISRPPVENKVLKIHAGVWIALVSHRAAEYTIQVFAQIRDSTLEFIRIRVPNALRKIENLAGLEQSLTGTVLNEPEIKQCVTNYFYETTHDSSTQIQDWTTAVMQLKSEVQRVNGYA